MVAQDITLDYSKYDFKTLLEDPEHIDELTKHNHPTNKWNFAPESEDIDWTEDKPEGGIPFYCPLCHMTIEEKATYDGVFQHNKQLHDMSDEDAETLAKGFTFSNSPPTETDDKLGIKELKDN